MRKITRTYECYWSERQVCSFVGLLMVRGLDRHFWDEGFCRVDNQGYGYDFHYLETLHIQDPHKLELASEFNLAIYDPGRYIQVSGCSNVEVRDDAVLMAPAPAWAIEYRFNYADKSLSLYDSELIQFVYHIQTVRSATIEVGGVRVVLLRDGDSFKVICKLEGAQEENDLHIVMMEWAHR